MITLYKITNIINGKLYIGQTKNSIKFRWLQHKNKASHCTLLSNAISKHGKQSFKIEEIAIVNTREEANILEQALIIQYNSMYPTGYNLTSGGFVCETSEVTKQKISKANLGRRWSLKNKRKSMSEEQKLNISKTLKGKTPSNKGKGKKIICTDTGIIYDNALLAANLLKLDDIAIRKVASGKLKTTGGYRFKYC